MPYPIGWAIDFQFNYLFIFLFILEQLLLFNFFISYFYFADWNSFKPKSRFSKSTKLIFHLYLRLLRGCLDQTKKERGKKKKSKTPRFIYSLRILCSLVYVFTILCIPF